MRVNFKLPLFTLLVGLMLLIGACSDGDDSITEGVASVSDLDETVEDAEAVAASIAAEDANAGGAETPEEVALAFSVCMRDNGFDDFPDPVINADGTPDVRAAIVESGIDFASQDFREQIDVCRDEVGADQFGAGGRGGQAREEVQENLLGYTQCLRNEGLDVGDLTPPGQGQQGQAQGDDQQGPGAGRPGGGAASLEDRAQRLAGVLGLDAEDPDTAEALAACDDVLVEAFAGLGRNG